MSSWTERVHSPGRSLHTSDPPGNTTAIQERGLSQMSLESLLGRVAPRLLHFLFTRSHRHRHILLSQLVDVVLALKKQQGRSGLI